MVDLTNSNISKTRDSADELLNLINPQPEEEMEIEDKDVEGDLLGQEFYNIEEEEVEDGSREEEAREEYGDSYVDYIRNSLDAEEWEEWKEAYINSPEDIDDDFENNQELVRKQSEKL